MCERAGFPCSRLRWLKTMACTGPGTMVGIRVNVATVEQHGIVVVGPSGCCCLASARAPLEAPPCRRTTGPPLAQLPRGRSMRRYPFSAAAGDAPHGNQPARANNLPVSQPTQPASRNSALRGEPTHRILLNRHRRRPPILGGRSRSAAAELAIDPPRQGDSYDTAEPLLSGNDRLRTLSDANVNTGDSVFRNS